MNRIVAIILLCSPAALAKTVYITQTGAGNGSGTSLANAASAAFFNTPANWGGGAGQINPGDTVSLNGIITSQLTVQAGGTLAISPTIIQFAAGAVLQSPDWDSSGALVVGFPNVTVDGGATGALGGPFGNTNQMVGIIESTNNGQGLGFTNANARGVFINSVTNVVVKGLTVRGLYYRTAGGDQGSGGNQGVYAFGCSICVVSNCLFYNEERGAMFVVESGNTNIEYSYNTAFNVNWGGACGSGGNSCTLTNLLVHHNLFYGFSNWDDTSLNNSYHHNGFFTFTSYLQTGTIIYGVRYYNNEVGTGTAGEWGSRTSGALFIQDKVFDVWWYNNIFTTDSSSAPADALVFINPVCTNTTTYRVYNNTFNGQNNIGAGIMAEAWQQTGSIENIIVQNNIFNRTRYADTIYDSDSFSLTQNHNLAYNNDPATPWSFSTTESASFKSTAQWQSLGFDADLITTNPGLGANSQLTTGSPAIGVGANESAFFTTDFGGTARAGSGPWDIGAYAYVSDPTITVEPQNVTVTAPATATFTVTATTGSPPLAYQWSKNGSYISGATLSSYTTPATTTGDNGELFACQVCNSTNACVTSASALLTVNSGGGGTSSFNWTSGNSTLGNGTQ